MIENRFSEIVERFKYYYPDIYSQATTWCPSGAMCITVKLQNGTIYEYNRLDNTIREIRLRGTCRDEERSNREFGYNLQKCIQTSGLKQGEVAERLGITKSMLSRYIHGKSIPSVVKARDMAEILGCRIDDLFDIDYI